MAEAPASRLSVDDRHPQSFDDDRHRQSFSERNLHLQYELNEDDRHLRHPRHRRLPMSQRRDPFLLNLTEARTCLSSLNRQKHLRSPTPSWKSAILKATSPSAFASQENSSLSGNLRTSLVPICSRNSINSDDLSTSEKTTDRR